MSKKKQLRSGRSKKSAGSRGSFARYANAFTAGKNRAARIERHLEQHPNDIQAKQALSSDLTMRTTPRHNTARVSRLGMGYRATKGFDIFVDRRTKELRNKLTGALITAPEPTTVNRLSGKLSAEGKKEQMIAAEKRSRSKELAYEGNQKRTRSHKYDSPAKLGSLVDASTLKALQSMAR